MRFTSPVYLLDLTLGAPEQNLALDEALLLSAESGETAELLRLWESASPAVVLGKNCRASEDVWLDRCEADGVAVLRRASGGGTVLQGRGCLNFSLVLRYDRAAGLDDVAQSFRHVLERIRSRIASVAAVAVVRCAQDLVIDGRKFNGNAQRRLRSHFLHQGSILYEFDLALIARYLKEPQRQPAYRAGRDHLSFLTNLNCDGLLLRDCLRSAWDADALAADWPQELMQRLTEERYSQPSWTYRL